jgi:hypothetical protein
VAKWQTRYVQGVVGVTPWEFKSPLRHHLQIGWLPELTSISLGNSLKVERLILDQVVGVRIPVPQPKQQALDRNDRGLCYAQNVSVVLNRKSAIALDSASGQRHHARLDLRLILLPPAAATNAFQQH